MRRCGRARRRRGRTSAPGAPRRDGPDGRVGRKVAKPARLSPSPGAVSFTPRWTGVAPVHDGPARGVRLARGGERHPPGKFLLVAPLLGRIEKLVTRVSHPPSHRSSHPISHSPSDHAMIGRTPHVRCPAGQSQRLSGSASARSCVSPAGPSWPPLPCGNRCPRWQRWRRVSDGSIAHWCVTPSYVAPRCDALWCYASA